MLASQASQENFAFFNYKIWENSEIRILVSKSGGGGAQAH